MQFKGLEQGKSLQAFCGRPNDLRQSLGKKTAFENPGQFGDTVYVGDALVGHSPQAPLLYRLPAEAEDFAQFALTQAECSLNLGEQLSGRDGSFRISGIHGSSISEWPARLQALCKIVLQGTDKKRLQAKSKVYPLFVK